MVRVSEVEKVGESPLRMEGVERRNGLYGFEYAESDQRRKPRSEGTYHIKQLWQRSHEILNLAARGFKNVEIAEILNIDPSTVSATINSDLGEKKLSELRYGRDLEAKKDTEKIRVLTKKAISVYNEVFDDDSGELGLKDKKDAAKDVLMEFSGLRVPTRIQSQSVSTVLTSEELEAFKARGTAAARASGLIVDITSEGKDEPETASE